MSDYMKEAKRLADAIVREVAELPDRDSPADWPAAMLVTSDELRGIVLAHIQRGAVPEGYVIAPAFLGYAPSDGSVPGGINRPARGGEAVSDRHELQAAGTHPAPCARHCESTAYEIEIRRLRAELAASREREARMRGVAMLLRGRLLLENPNAVTDDADAALAEGSQG